MSTRREFLFTQLPEVALATAAAVTLGPDALVAGDKKDKPKDEKQKLRELLGKIEVGESDPNGALIKEIINKGEQYATHAKIGGYDAITFIPPIETKKYYPALTILLDKADEEKMVIRSVMSEWKSESSDLTTTDYTIDKDHDGEPECRLVIASERDIPIVLRQELIDNPLGYLTTRVKELNARNDKGSLIAKARVANTYFTHKNDAGEEIEWEFQLDNTFRLVTTDEKSTNERRVNHLKSEDFTGAIKYILEKIRNPSQKD